MHLRTLRYFVTLAREEHFARAADACGVTQPTLSAALLALEEDLGKRLVLRDRRYIGLTDEGRAMLPWAQQMLAAHEGMVQAIDALAGPVHGEVRLGAIPAAMPAIGSLSQALLKTQPGLTLSVRSLTSREIERGLAAFDLDAGLTYLDHEPPANMLTVPLYAERYIFLAKRGAGYDERDRIGWDEAVAGPLCLLHQTMQNRRILDAHLAGRGLVPGPRATANSYVALLAMVRSGGFATIIPDSYAAMFQGMGWAQMLRFEEPQPVSRIGLVIIDRKPISPLAGAAIIAAQQVSKAEIDHLF